MKKFIFIFLCLICNLFLFSKIGLTGNTFVTEGFENPGYENPICNPNIQTSCWTEYIDPNGQLNDELTCDSCSPEQGNYCLYAYSSGYGQYARTMWVLDEPKQVNTISFRIRVTEHNLTNTKVIRPVVLTTVAGSELAIIQLYYYNNQMFISYAYWNGYIYPGFSYADYIPINEYKWNLIEVRYDLEKLKTSLKVNHRTVYNDNNLGTASTTEPRKLWVGVHYNNGIGPAGIEISSLEWSD